MEKNMAIKKAVIPAAGLGTRLFPAVHACKKELFPVVGPDGIARAMLHYQVMDLLDAGIKEICVIVRPGQEKLVTNYFKGPGAGYMARLKKHPALYDEAKKMRAALDRISFAVQETQEGYGHAVYQSKKFAANEPVLLCLGDHLFRWGDKSCHSRLMQAYEACKGRPVSAVNRIHAQDLKGYGVIAGTRKKNAPCLIDVSLIIEKPGAKTAEKKLKVNGLKPGEFLGWFGMHVLTPGIYDVLGAMIAGNIRQRGEIQLTHAQELLRQRQGYCALEINDARRFDFGTPRDFVKSAMEFAKK
jgi:UTP--glucose-1-phosphate uridylyltransferase